MKKILLLTVFAFGLADFIAVEDCYAAVESSTGTTVLTKNQKKKQRKKAAAAKKAEAEKGSAPVEDGATAMVPASIPSRDPKRSPVLAIEDAEPQLTLARVTTETGLAAAGSSGESTMVPPTVDDPKAQKAWDKNVASVKGTLGTLKAAVDQLDKSAESYKRASPDDQIKEQNAIEGFISSILKSIESIQGSIDSLGRFKGNQSIQKYLAAFVNDLGTKTKDAFLSTSRRGAQVDPTKVTVTTKSIGAIKATLEPLNQFLLQHRKFLGGMRSLKPTPENLGATYSFDPSVPKGDVAVEVPFKPTVDEKMFEGKKDKDIIGMLAAYQEEVQELIKKLQDFTAGESEKTKDQENVKQAKALTYKATRDDQLKKAMALKVEDRKYKMASTAQQKEMITGVKNSIVVIETYRQELEHMLKVLQDAQAKSAGSVQAKADRELIETFHETLDKVLGAMVARVGNAQQLRPLFQQWMPKKQDTLGILKLGATAKQAKLAEVGGWLTTLKTVTVK